MIKTPWILVAPVILCSLLAMEPAYSLTVTSEIGNFPIVFQNISFGETKEAFASQMKNGFKLSDSGQYYSGKIDGDNVFLWPSFTKNSNKLYSVTEIFAGTISDDTLDYDNEATAYQEHKKRFNTFEQEQQDEFQNYCNSLIAKYGNPFTIMNKDVDNDGYDEREVTWRSSDGGIMLGLDPELDNGKEEVYVSSAPICIMYEKKQYADLNKKEKQETAH